MMIASRLSIDDANKSRGGGVVDNEDKPLAVGASGALAFGLLSLQTSKRHQPSKELLFAHSL